MKKTILILSLLLSPAAFAGTNVTCALYDKKGHGVVLSVDDNGGTYLLYAWKGDSWVLRNAPNALPALIDISTLPSSIQALLKAGYDGRLICPK